MANQNDSFIDEVTDELRRDRLFNLFRRYGWIAILVILAIVGGAIWYEWTASRDQAEAQAWGDAVLSAEGTGDPAELLKVDPQGSTDRETLAALLAAGRLAESDEKVAATEALSGLSEGRATSDILNELAQLKLVMLQGTDMDATKRDEILSHLSRSGAPFELLALEQKAAALIGAGRTDDAISLIQQIQDMPGLSQGLRRRLSEMMIGLGVEPEPSDVLPVE